MSPAGHGEPLRAVLARAVSESWTPSAAWHVSGPAGVISAGAVGLACREPEAVVATEATPYDLASLTKPLATAVLLVRLDERGAISLDEPAGERLPELCGSAWGDRTPRELATHVAGLPAWHPCYLEAHEARGYLSAIARLPAARPRGEMLYSDLGYLILGALVERAAGEPLDRLFRRHVAAPLGLTRIGYATDERRFADAAATERGNAFERRLAGPAGARHAWREAVIRGEVHDGNAHGLGGVAGHAGLFGTAAEVAAIGRALLEPSSSLDLGVAARRNVLQPIPGGLGRSVGFVAARDASAARSALPEDAPGHTGFTGTSLWLEPARRRVYVLLSNRVHPAVQERGFDPVRQEFHRHAAQLPD